jgi:hypothetical protein
MILFLNLTNLRKEDSNRKKRYKVSKCQHDSTPFSRTLSDKRIQKNNNKPRIITAQNAGLKPVRRMSPWHEYEKINAKVYDQLPKE